MSIAIWCLNPGTGGCVSCRIIPSPEMWRPVIRSDSTDVSYSFPVVLYDQYNLKEPLADLLYGTGLPERRSTRFLLPQRCLPPWDLKSCGFTGKQYPVLIRIPGQDLYPGILHLSTIRTLCPVSANRLAAVHPAGPALATIASYILLYHLFRSLYYFGRKPVFRN